MTYIVSGGALNSTHSLRSFVFNTFIFIDASAITWLEWSSALQSAVS